MRKRLILFWITSIVTTTSAQQITFQKTYGGRGGREGYSCQQTTDGGYIIGGGTDCYGAGMDDIYLVKTDSLGDTLWTRTFGNTAPDLGISTQQTANGSYVLAGYIGVPG